MNKDFFIKKTKKLFENDSRKILIEQIDCFYECLNKFKLEKSKYKIGEQVLLKQGTLLHGTYRNIDGIYDISKNGLIASWFIDGRISKYPSSVGVWNLKKDYLLKDYINFYSGGTIKYSGILVNGEYSQQIKTAVIPFDEMNNIIDIVKNNQCRIWTMEQTKEARFMPSLVQEQVQVGIIFNMQNFYAQKLITGDILNDTFFDDVVVKQFVNENYYNQFIVDRKNKDDFFTDRESAILFGLPSNLIEGILVGREYEKNIGILQKIKEYLPNCYICNLDGIVVME